jgi:hypothetical protein
LSGLRIGFWRQHPKMLFFNGFLSSLILLSSAPSLVFSQSSKSPPDSNRWSGWGANIFNNRWVSENTLINSTTISTVVEHCKITYPGGVSATPVVLKNTAYYPTANGSFVALNYVTCSVQWQINVTDIIYKFAPLSALQLNATLPASRTSPQIDGNVLYFGTQSHALLVAVDLSTGATLDTMQVNDHPVAIVTMSPTVYKGVAYVGSSSQEEVASLLPASFGFECCSFIGNFMAAKFDIKAKKFNIVWNKLMLPEHQGWSGAAIWGSQPAIDTFRNQVFVATGNIYEFPPEMEKCQNATASCLPADILQEAVLAIDIPTGNINWVRQLSALDGWVMACNSVPKSDLCPNTPGPDADFGMAPTFVPAALGSGTTGVDAVVVGQKNGNLYSLKADTGESQWAVATSPDSNVGGLSWGIAADDTNIYFVGINYGNLPWPLKPQGGSINNSAYGSASLKDGTIHWETPAPNDNLAYAPPGVVNDIVLVSRAGSAKEFGSIIALSKTNGTIIHDMPIDSVQRGGITVQDGFVIFGTGYHYDNPYNTGSFYVMALPGTGFFETTDGGDGVNGTSTTAPVSKASNTAKATKKSEAMRSGGISFVSVFACILGVLVGLKVWI